MNKELTLLLFFENFPFRQAYLLEIHHHNAENSPLSPYVSAYKSPTYKSPTYKSPTYKSPTYKSPTYKSSTYKSPTYKSPTYQSPTFKYSHKKTYVISPGT